MANYSNIHTKSTTVSTKIDNFEYAPGHATYGIDGSTGLTGAAGNCIFFTTFNIKGNEDIEDFKYAMQQNILPIKNGTKIGRIFQNGDYFIDVDGNIFELKDKKRLVDYPIISNKYQTYFNIVGQIKSLTKPNNIFSKVENTNRISLNTQFGGIDINNDALREETVSDNNYALRIFGDNTSGSNNGNVDILKATAFFEHNEKPEFKLYYDNDDNMWHMESDIPIVINSDMLVASTSSYDQLVTNSEYSSVILHETPFTTFHNTAKYVKWFLNKGILNFTNIDKIPAEIKSQLFVKIITKTLNDSTKSFEFNTSMYQLKELSDIQFNTNKRTVITQVSLIYNIEIFIQQQTE